MGRTIATYDPAVPRHVVVHEEVARIWVPTRAATSLPELGDIALAAAAWRRIGDWQQTAGVWAAPVEPDPGQPLDQYERDLAVGDERRKGERS